MAETLTGGALMATAVFFHAHPDDEAIITGGTMLLASQAGHRVVAVCATDGSLGATSALNVSEPDDIRRNDDGAIQSVAAVSPVGRSTRRELAAVRESELRDAATILGVHRVEMLGYVDSGMDGDPANADPDCFWQADPLEAAERLAAILREEQADLLTCYDDNGGYGHPDHIQVHRVGVLAADIAGIDTVYEATMDRDHFRDSMEQVAKLAADAGVEMVSAAEQAEMESDLDAETFGSDSSLITHQIDVRSVLAEKRAAMVAHASQIPPDSFFVALPDEAFELVSATEWYIRRGVTRDGPCGTDIFAPLTC